MRLSLVILFAVSGLAAAAVTAPSASASCLWTPEEERIARADVIFEGTALEGATETGIQQFRVDRYLKSSGPEVVSVKTNNRYSNGFWSISSVDIAPQPGSEWRIFGRLSSGGVLETNTCMGSRRLPLPRLGQEPRPQMQPDPGRLIVQAPPDANVPSLYKNCTNFNKKYPHGVGRRGARDKTSGTRVTTIRRSTPLYNIAMRYNDDLDRDKDGIACEKK